MEETKGTNVTDETREAPSPMEQIGAQQLRYAKLQCLFSLITAVLFAVVVVVVLCFVPRINGLIEQADAILENADHVTRQLAQADIAGVMADLEDVSQQMAEADLGGLAQDVSSLVQTTQVSVEEAMGKLNAIDLKSLNQAIEDLAAVMQPLSNFFGRSR